MTALFWYELKLDRSEQTVTNIDSGPPLSNHGVRRYKYVWIVMLFL